MKTTKSRSLFKQAQLLFPGGVNSPVRAFRAVGGMPLFIEKAKGSRLYDVDGNAFIDYVLSWGPMILGHAHPAVVKAIKKAVDKGTSYGAPCPLEVELASMIMDFYPSIEKMRMVSSGTEATMSAIRAARGFTGRDMIIKFEGCYHGHADGLLVKAGSGAATFGVPDSPGVPKDYAKLTLALPFNDTDAFRAVMRRNGKRIACVIVEPVVGNIGCIMPAPGFLDALRAETSRSGTVLIFDEVMTGFRVSRGGAQETFGIKPDLTCLGKVIGGGLPVGAYGGRADIMEMISPEGPVYQAGTLSGNPIAMTAGIETLKVLKKKSTYSALEKTMLQLEAGLKDAAKKAGVSAKLYRAGTMFCTYFTDVDVVDYATAKTADTAHFGRFFMKMLEQGIYLAPSQFEAGFVSLAHGKADIDATVEAAFRAFRAVR
ncbi:MAG TPA: glutamate-1-semialdehyde 2,1-aminomutase [Dissulfurispiraceae bacterium]|nr:glutamate-1-semialdehyde 2,1-aminomutase [Dissulfurispiraceae bacterium]